MKILFVFVTVFCFVSCSIREKKATCYYLSAGIENIKIFPASKEDSAKVYAVDLAAEKNLQKCRKKMQFVLMIGE